METIDLSVQLEIKNNLEKTLDKFRIAEEAEGIKINTRDELNSKMIDCLSEIKEEHGFSELLIRRSGAGLKIFFKK